MRNTGRVAAIALLAVAASGCFTGFRKVRAPAGAPVPEAGSEVAFAMLMTPGVAEGYIGADVVTTAQFMAPGAGLMNIHAPVKDRVVIRCLPPGGVAGPANPLSGERDANWVAIPREAAGLLATLQPGDRLRLRGGTHVSAQIIGGYRQVVFMATSVERDVPR